MLLGNLEIGLLVSVIALAILIAVVYRRSGYKHKVIADNQLKPNNYQNYPPSLPVERRYHSCADECDGSSDRSQCLEKCRLMAHRHGMGGEDRCDHVCHAHRGDEKAFYKCLGLCYSDYRTS